RGHCVRAVGPVGLPGFETESRVAPLLRAMENYKLHYWGLGSVATTTIQLSQEMKKTLEGMKLHPRETYEEVLERLLEDLRELNEQTKEEIERAVREIQAGKYRSHDQLKSEMGF
ncbi:MAG: hypothetical protein ACE5JQ_10885, partial [Candidatus Methylomirabilales bacterium]